MIRPCDPFETLQTEGWRDFFLPFTVRSAHNLIFPRDFPSGVALVSAGMKIPLSALADPFYEGSVQRLFAVPGDDSVMVTQTTAKGSVFDVGALFEIAGNDVNRALFRHALYSGMKDPEMWKRVREAIQKAPELNDSYRSELLEGVLESCCERGAKTHHEGMLDAETGEVSRSGVPNHPSAYNVVRKYQILKPTRAEFLGAHLFDYSQFAHEDGFVVPLEYIVRFGITSASSVYKKYVGMDERSRKAFETELGVSKPLEAWQYLEKPIGDFTSKFEPEDRMVSKQEALAMSGLTGEQFIRSGKMAILGAWAVRQLVEQIGLLMWDIKWEFAIDEGELVFVDTIDTDSFRATMFLDFEGQTYVGHFNKQAMRDYFTLLHGDWIEDIKRAKSEGQKQGVAFTEILAVGQKNGTYAPTPDVAQEFLEIQEEKMSAIREFMLGNAEAATVKKDLEAAGFSEITFYRDRGVLEGLKKINGIS